jgi:hypothetical protein
MPRKRIYIVSLADSSTFYQITHLFLNTTRHRKFSTLRPQKQCYGIPASYLGGPRSESQYGGQPSCFMCLFSILSGKFWDSTL